MEEIKLWKIAMGPSVKPKATPAEKIAETETEQLLEEVLAISPELLMPDLILIGRQTDTPGGPLDLLGVDEDGRLVIFELKRGNLTRDAVAQAIDYASYLAGLESEDLCRHIKEHSGKGGTEPIDDFGTWYQSRFESPVGDIGQPRIMLVGLGVDERAKRMVTFLAQCELDISLITFHGFKQGGELLLARQVEVQSQQPAWKINSKVANQAKLDKQLADLGIKQSYEELIVAMRKGLGDSVYQWPNASGYSFSLPAVSATGGRTLRVYCALYTPTNQNGKMQIVLQKRALDSAGEGSAERAAKAMGSNFVLKPSGYGEIWIDGRKPASGFTAALTDLCQEIAAGWRAHIEKDAKAEAEDVASGTK